MLKSTTRLHEVLAAEDAVVSAADKVTAETTAKFHKPDTYFMGSIRTLKRINDSAEDKAIEASNRREKNLPTNVPNTIGYMMGLVAQALALKLVKHATNQTAVADVELDGKVFFKAAPVDFLLDMEKLLPRWREMFIAMPTLDASKEWVTEAKGIYKTKDAMVSAQTEKIVYPVVLAAATDKHPAQVKESSKDVTVGTFHDLAFSGAATTQQKADCIALCDKLIVAFKQARMRANSTAIVMPSATPTAITSLFTDILGA